MGKEIQKKEKKKSKAWMIWLRIILIFAVAWGLGQLSSGDEAYHYISQTSPWDIRAGIFDFLLIIPIGKLIVYASDFTGNLMGGILTAAVVIHVLMTPLYIKASLSDYKMKLLKPKVEEMKKIYTGDNAELKKLGDAKLNELYKKNKISIFASLYTLLSLPLTIAFWRSVARLEMLPSAELMGISLSATPLRMMANGAVAYGLVIVAERIIGIASAKISEYIKKGKPKREEGSKKVKQFLGGFNIFSTLLMVWCTMQIEVAMSFYLMFSHIIDIIRTYVIEKLILPNMKIKLVTDIDLTLPVPKEKSENDENVKEDVVPDEAVTE